jgi:hypothetical protein
MEYIFLNNNFFSNRAQRLFKYYKLRISFIFSYKSFIRIYPKSLIFGILIINLCINSFLLYIWERVGSDIPNEFFDNYGFTLWHVLLAMSRLGYGDSIPHSVFGRMMSAYISISGVIIAAMFTLVIKELLFFNNNQETCYDSLELIRQKDILNGKINELMNKTLHLYNNLMLKYKRRRNKFTDSNLGFFYNLIFLIILFLYKFILIFLNLFNI